MPSAPTRNIGVRFHAILIPAGYFCFERQPLSARRRSASIFRFNIFHSLQQAWLRSGKTSLSTIWFPIRQRTEPIRHRRWCRHAPYGQVLPNAVGDQTQWSRIGGAVANWASVDGQAYQTTSYNTTSQSGTFDYYNITDLPGAPTTIDGVVVTACAQRRFRNARSQTSCPRERRR